MRKRYIFLIPLFGLIAFAVNLRADTSLPAYYPSSYNAIIAGAKREVSLVIYSNFHSVPLQNDLLASFKKKYPFIRVTDIDDDGARISQRFVKEVARGEKTADLVLSSAMDLQEKLINDGYAQPYQSPETRFLAPWAHWKDLGYGTSSEPIVFVYNRRFINSHDMARTHPALEQELASHRQRYQGRIAVYDPSKSEVGMLFLSQDVRATPDSWNLFDEFNAVNAVEYSTSQEMLQHVIRGDQWIAYDVIGSYATALQHSNPELVIVYPSDYMLTMSRVAFISASATHPNAAKLFLDFLLSDAGQASLLRYGLGTIRNSSTMTFTKEAGRAQAIRIGPGLLAGLDSLVRAQFLRRWTRDGLSSSSR
jgi:iron(III) transport system substrate-binding protein